MYVIQKVHTPAQIKRLRDLLYDYGVMRRFDAALGDYQKELDQLPGKYAAPGGCILTAEMGDAAIACVAYQALNHDTCEMKRLYVQEAHRGQGLARQLVQQLLDEARRAGYRVMRLDTHPHMQAAQSLYQSFGFREIGRYNDNPTPGIRFFELQLA